jgi:beta-carotene ketolase (CrtO type)
MHDVVVVGAGHHGLTCAAYLARAGRRVMVLEAEPVVGGMTRTEESIPGAPGFLVNKCAVDTILLHIPRSIVGELGLPRHGLRFVAADPYCTWLHPDGHSICFWRDLERTAREIGRFSAKDAERYRRFASVLIDLWYTAMPYVQGHPRRIGVRTFAEILGRAARTRRSLAPAVRIMAQTPTEALEEWFDRDEVKTALALWVLAGMTDLDTPGGSAVLSMFVLTHRWGCKRVVGGMGELSRSLADCIRSHGGEIRTSTPVKEVLVSDGRATGVVTADGEEVLGSLVVGALDPHTLMTELVDPVLLPVRTRDELRGMSVLGKSLSTFKGDVALSELPRFAKVAGRERELWGGGYVMFAPDLQYVRRAVAANARGELAAEIPLWVSMPTLLDRSLVPPGSAGQSLYVYVPAVPHRLAGALEWDDVKDRYLDRCLRVLEEYAPGTRAAVIGRPISRSPADFESLTFRGNIFGVDMTPAQIGPWRPVPTLAGYRTPIAGLWHASAGSHAAPAVNGWAGRTLARTLLRDERRARMTVSALDRFRHPRGRELAEGAEDALVRVNGLLDRERRDVRRVEDQMGDVRVP